ncbi:hypothetical protein [Deinococcus sonorensis]|uniref:Uncharacterized protein n=2 Tax=Deinococcus sonorensis TaxID=309891 RepID=A0AAU7UAJ6_9DEIO
MVISLKKRLFWLVALAVIVGVVVGAMAQLTAGLALGAALLVASLLLVAVSSVWRHRHDVRTARRFDVGAGSAS